MSEAMAESCGTTGRAAARPARARHAIAAATIGNLLETYDMAVYGYFALVISRLFFPTGDETASLMLAVATFGVGFIMRPVGALVIGAIADRRGRKPALTLTISLMAFATLLIGMLPTYSQVGVAAPVVLVVARLVQGFSAGGEVGTATIFLIEHAPWHRRGFFGSFQQVSQALALLLGSLLGSILNGALSQAAMESWGWRIPFLLGVLIGPVGFYIRWRVPEPQSPASVARSSGVGEVVRAQGRNMVTGFAIAITWTVCMYFFLVYMPTYATHQLHLASAVSLAANTIGLATMLVLAPVFGALSDRTGRRPILLASALAIALLTYPMLWVLSSAPSVFSLTLIQVVLAILLAAFAGVAPSAMTEIFPLEVRTRGVSLSYNLSVAIFGGFAPFLATWLIARTGNALAPAWYVIASVTLSLSIILRYFHPPAILGPGVSPGRP